MSRTARIPGISRGRATALVLAGASAAAVLGAAGTANATTSQPAALAGLAAAADNNVSLGASAGPLTGSGSAATLATAAGPAASATLASPVPAAQVARTGTAAPAGAAHAVPARHPAQVPVTRHPAHSRHEPARHADGARHAKAGQHGSPGREYEIYDSVNPAAIPAHVRVATYADGGYAVSPSAVARDGRVLWIDTDGSDPRAQALDVEPGDATPSGAAAWARAKLTADPDSPAIIYTMRSEWGATQAAIATLPARMRSEIRWWIADPTGRPHIVPGASATQWYWGHNYDISSAKPGF